DWQAFNNSSRRSASTIKTHERKEWRTSSCLYPGPPSKLRSSGLALLVALVFAGAFACAAGLRAATALAFAVILAFVCAAAALAFARVLALAAVFFCLGLGSLFAAICGRGRFVSTGVLRHRASANAGHEAREGRAYQQ